MTEIINSSSKKKRGSKIVFTSGCYDLLHAGHIQFFREARALGDYLVVCFASKEVLLQHKGRISALPDEHKKALMEELECVDECVIGSVGTLGLDFEEAFLEIKPQILAVTDDDKYMDIKLNLCSTIGCKYIKLPKTPPKFGIISTTDIRRTIAAPVEVPLRIDFAGGWLDVPRFARDGGHIVNVAISPCVSLSEWNYHQRSGLGGSGAISLLRGEDAISSEVVDLGVGWQDPAVISETGLCVWRSGSLPSLEFKSDGSFLKGLLALYWTGLSHDTPNLADLDRDFDLIYKAGEVATKAVRNDDLFELARAIEISYEMQMKEGMTELTIPALMFTDEALKEGRVLAKKYVGGGFGGYAVYLCSSLTTRDKLCTLKDFRPVEPFIRL